MWAILGLTLAYFAIGTLLGAIYLVVNHWLFNRGFVDKLNSESLLTVSFLFVFAWPIVFPLCLVVVGLASLNEYLSGGNS